MEIQDYCSSSSFDIQMEKIVVKLGTNPVPFVGGLPHNLFLPLGTVFIAMSLSKASCYHPPKTSLEYIGLHTTLCLTSSPTLAWLFVWELVL